MAYTNQHFEVIWSLSLSLPPLPPLPSSLCIWYLQCLSHLGIPGNTHITHVRDPCPHLTKRSITPGSSKNTQAPHNYWQYLKIRMLIIARQLSTKTNICSENKQTNKHHWKVSMFTDVYLSKSLQSEKDESPYIWRECLGSDSWPELSKLLMQILSLSSSDSEPQCSLPILLQIHKRALARTHARTHTHTHTHWQR